jgi:fructosamine-3-kinase
MVSNFLALTPLDNTWEEDWAVFLKKRFDAQIDALTKVGRFPNM